MKRKLLYCVIFLIICCLLFSCVTDQGKDFKKDTNPNRIENKLRDNTVRISIIEDGKEVQSGSGFVIKYKKKNYVITNAHVIGYYDGESIEIRKKSPEGKLIRFYNAKVTIADEDNDLAVLTALDLDSMRGLPVQDSRNILQSVIAAGFPGGPENPEEITITMSAGKISNPLVKVENRERIKLDMGVNPGNSGGPLVNEKGEVLGVVYMKYLDNTAYAIPIDQVLKTIDDIEESAHEKVIMEIAESKLEQFMQELVYNTPDTSLSINLFTLDFCLSINLFFETIRKFSLHLSETYELTEIPGPSGKLYEPFKTELLKLSIEYKLFNNLNLGKSMLQQKKLIKLGYDSNYEFFAGAVELSKRIENLEIPQEKKAELKGTWIREYSRICSKELLNNIVYAHFDDVRTIENFKIIKIIPSTVDKSIVYGLVRIKYLNGFENMKFELKYSRGKWGISSIGEGILEDVTSDEFPAHKEIPKKKESISQYVKSTESNQLYTGEKVPYRFWVDDSKWQLLAEKTNPASDYEFMYQDKLLMGFIIAEKIYLPIDTLRKAVLVNANQASPGAHVIFEEQRIVNNAEMFLIILEVPMDEIQLDYICCYYVYSRESFGSIQIVTTTLKDLYENEKDIIYKFLNGIEVLPGR